MKKQGCIWVLAIMLGLAALGALLPPSATTLYEKAQRKYEQKNYTEALVQINQAIEKDYSVASFFDLRAKIYDALSDTLQPHTNYVHSLSLIPQGRQKVKKLKEIIQWDISHDHPAEAQQLFKQHVSNIQADTVKLGSIINYMFQQYLTNQDTVEGIYFLEEQMTEFPSLSIPILLLGELYYQQAKYPLAVRYYNKYLHLNPKDSEVWFNLALSYRQLKSPQNELQAFKKSANLGNRKGCLNYRELTAETRYYKRSKCCDGSLSNSTGRGTCSHHGGVCGLEYIPYKHYTIDCR